MDNRLNFLVANDDGIDALGIHKLAEALSEVGNVYVSSPHQQQSASGHGITIGRPIFLDDAAFAEARQAISLEGTPADCVKIGFQVYRDQGIDIDAVFSGFNHGINIGTDTLYSGTVSAAVEGALIGLPSFAMSISSKKAFHRDPEYFETAGKMARYIAGSGLIKKQPPGGRGIRDINFIHEDHVILNVNIPDIPPDEIKGIKVCPLAYRAYDDWFREQGDDHGRRGYRYAGLPAIIGEADPDESDIIANDLGYVTITPLKFDLTDRQGMDSLRCLASDWKL